MDEKRFHFETLFLLNLIDTPFPSNLASIRSCLNSKKWDGRRHDRWGTNDFFGLTAWCGKDVQLKAMAQFEALFFFKNCRFLSLHKHCHHWALVSSKLCIISALHSSKAGDLFFIFSLSLSPSLSLLYASWFPVVFSPIYNFKGVLCEYFIKTNKCYEWKWLLKDMKTPDAQ